MAPEPEPPLNAPRTLPSAPAETPPRGQAAASTAVSVPHPRTIGWFGTAALAMGGSNQSLFLLAALIAGQYAAPGHGSAAIPLLIVGLVLSLAAAPGWTELVLMRPNRVGGIAAACSEAFRPYNPLLAALTGTCYWWGWALSSGLTAMLEASAIHQWFAPYVSVTILAGLIVILSVIVNLCPIRWIVRLAMPVAVLAMALAFVSALAPVIAGQVDWVQAATIHLTTPFGGAFGSITSVMAGIFLVVLVAPGFESALGFVGETIAPARNVPRAMLASALVAVLYYVILPIIWLGVFGPIPLTRDLALELGPTFAPVFGSAAKAAAIGFMAFNLFPGTIQPLANASRALAQLAEDGLLPRLLALRNRADAPWVAIVATAVPSLAVLGSGAIEPLPLLAATALCYLIAISMPSVAVWLLRRDAPDLARPYRAPRGMIGLGLCAAAVWFVAAILGFEQFGIFSVLTGLTMAYSGIALFVWRKVSDRRRAGLPGFKRSLHLTLTGAMTLVLALNAAGYQLAITRLPMVEGPVIAGLEDIFVLVALLTLAVGLLLPGMIAHSVGEVSDATKRLVSGALFDFTRAIEALGEGNLAAAKVDFDFSPVVVSAHDEIGEMAGNFNALQREMQRSAVGLAGAREGLGVARQQLLDSNRELVARIDERSRLIDELTEARDAAQAAAVAKGRFVAKMSHEIRTPLNGVLTTLDLLAHSDLSPDQRRLVSIIEQSGATLLARVNEVLDYAKADARAHDVQDIEIDFIGFVRNRFGEMSARAAELQIDYRLVLPADRPALPVMGDPLQLTLVLHNVIGNALKFIERGTVSVELGVIDETAESVRCEFCVADTGIGMSEEFQSRIFQPFEQANESTTRTVEGAGLGLSIVKEIVDSLGGDITIASRIGDGTTFTIRWPMRKAQPEVHTGWNAGEPTDELRNAVRILVAEDNAINQEVIAASLARLGHEFSIVENGAQALDALAQDNFSLVLMDCRMPVMDGFEATRAIRARENDRHDGVRIPILAISANTTQADRELCLACGMDDHIPKPFTLAQLSQKFAQWIPKLECPMPNDTRPTLAAANPQAPAYHLLDAAVLQGFAELQMPGQPSIISELIDSYFRTAPQQLHLIGAALEEGDFKGAMLAAHGMKSASAAIGLTALCEAFDSIEMAAHHGEGSEAMAIARDTGLLLKRSLRELSLFRANAD